MNDSCGDFSRRLSRAFLLSAGVVIASAMSVSLVVAEESGGQQNNVTSAASSATLSSSSSAILSAPELPPAAKADNSIYRCVQNGVQTWQQQPCHQGDAPVTLNDSLTVVPSREGEIPSGEENLTSERLEREKQQALAARQESQRQYRIRSAIDDGYLVQGMSESQAVSLLGKPSDTSETIADGTSCRLLSWWGDVRVQFCGDEAVSITANRDD
ncbi:hypothetical protein [Cobetia sp. L2A1]|uniref:hypothetical protein n=1 Tax=Cobetia sp. L2A1 TaxID=2686360 RepID=UPI00131E5207|nr:hypothetical protein [Cobetia sp. L2A1]